MPAERIVLMPQLGESVHEATVSRWLVRVGDQVVEYQPMVEIETDKVTDNIPAPFAGRVNEILVTEGSTVPVGAPLAVFATDAVPDAATPSADRQKPLPVGEDQRAGSVLVEESDEISRPTGGGGPMRPRKQPPDAADAGPVDFLSPAVRSLLERTGVPADVVTRTGKHGRLRKADVVQHLRSRSLQDDPASSTRDLPSLPQDTPVTANAAPAERALGSGDSFRPHSRLRKVIAGRMVESKSTIPHAWQMQEVDMTGLLAHRKAGQTNFKERTGYDLSMVAYVVKAVGNALRNTAEVNSTWTPEGLIFHSDINVAVSIGLEDGVMIPVIREVDSKSIEGIAVELGDLTGRARTGKLRPDDLARASVTVNNSGTFGTVLSYPVIPVGQVGILSMGAVRTRPMMVSGMLAFNSIMYLCFSLDHRVVDGLAAARFLTTCRQQLEGVAVEPKC